MCSACSCHQYNTAALAHVTHALRTADPTSHAVGCCCRVCHMAPPTWPSALMTQASWPPAQTAASACGAPPAGSCWAALLPQAALAWMCWRPPASPSAPAGSCCWLARGQTRCCCLTCTSNGCCTRLSWAPRPTAPHAFSSCPTVRTLQVRCAGGSSCLCCLSSALLSHGSRNSPHCSGMHHAVHAPG